MKSSHRPVSHEDGQNKAQKEIGLLKNRLKSVPQAPLNRKILDRLSRAALQNIDLTDEENRIIDDLHETYLSRKNLKLLVRRYWSNIDKNVEYLVKHCSCDPPKAAVHETLLNTTFHIISHQLRVKYWTVWDRDLAPEGDTLEETNHNLDESVEFVNELQHRHGIKPLWFAANLHYNSRYNNGALTSSEAQVISYAGAQIKKALEVAHKLGAESFLFRGVKEGYSSTLNTDHTRQLRNYARLLKMAADYKERLGYRGQLLFEPNYEDFYTNYPAGQAHYYGDQKTYYHYDYDTTSAICFLKQYGLDRQFKISSKPGHQLILASAYGMLGSVDATSITSPPPLSETTELIKAVIENGGLQPGGINIGVKLRPDSLDLKDLAVSYVATIDAFGKALRIATKIIADGVFIKNLQQRYLSFHSGFGSRFMNGEASLEECEEHTRKQNGDASYASGRSEHWQALFHRYTQN
ncbi:hypothetical protein J6590_039684 [Homalodisca vitripennis]|nr:hypothetical protein J6590_039684 [Homalodisca vitripennis]